MVEGLLDRVMFAVGMGRASGRIKSMRDIPKIAREKGIVSLSDGYMSTLTTRLRRDPGYKGKAEHLAAVAEVCGVNRDWLIFGEGSPDSDPGAANRHMIWRLFDEFHPRWGLGTMAAAVSLAHELDGDPERDWWIEQLDRYEAALKASTMPFPARKPG